MNRQALIFGVLSSLWLAVACAPQSADRAIRVDASVRPPDEGRVLDLDAGGADDGQVEDAEPSDAAAAPVDLTAAIDLPASDAAAIDAAATDVAAIDGAAVDTLLIDTATPEGASPPDADVSAPADSGPAVEAGPEAPVSATVLLVVGNPGALSAGDRRLRTAITSRGLTARLVDDDVVTVGVTGIRMVVISASCARATLSTKYRDVRVPLLMTQAAAYDTMGMTAATAADLGRTVSTTLTILMPGHPLAAGLQGDVEVVNTPSPLGWGRPAAGAERIAALPGMPDQIAIFAYAKGVMMASAPAPDRRVAFFAPDDATANPSDAGLRLLAAAIDWALLP